MKRANTSGPIFQKKCTSLRARPTLSKAEQYILQASAAIYIMCSQENIRTSHFASAFIQYQISAPPLQRNDNVEFLSREWNGSGLYTVVSDSPGNGKTWFVREALSSAKFREHKYVKHTLSNKVIDEQNLCQKLTQNAIENDKQKDFLHDMVTVSPKQPLAIHLVISPAIQYTNLDAVLFKLTMLKTLEAGNGEIWRMDSKSLLFIEVNSSWITQNTIARHLKQINVRSPQELLKQLGVTELVDDGPIRK
eukprot:12688340-Ditylum_brightwellii.AAC.1